MISLIVAYDRNRTIGINNSLPWHLPADLAYFKSMTMGKTIAMGRKTFESIGRLLPGRESVILTREKDYSVDGAVVVNSPDDLLSMSKGKEIFVIGGAEVYDLLLPLANKLYVTFIDEEFEGDTFFPEIDVGVWNLSHHRKGIRDYDNDYNYYYRTYLRKGHHETHS